MQEGGTMSGYSLKQFLAEVDHCTKEVHEPHRIVQQLAPAMARLLDITHTFLKPEHFADCPDHYARNAVHLCPSGTNSLFTMVWNPDQWTPVHDHGTWGVVGVVRGLFEERNFIRTDPCGGDTQIDLEPGAICLLTPGSVSTFVPTPDHIHKTGTRAEHPQCVTLHLYGRTMSDFNVYDIESRCRTRIAVAHTVVN
jgi:predicted metal-dependent enzyme (double-stranded beta helix superfamily)